MGASVDTTSSSVGTLLDVGEEDAEGFPIPDDGVEDGVDDAMEDGLNDGMDDKTDDGMEDTPELGERLGDIEALGDGDDRATFGAEEMGASEDRSSFSVGTLLNVGKDDAEGFPVLEEDGTGEPDGASLSSPPGTKYTSSMNTAPM